MINITDKTSDRCIMIRDAIDRGVTSIKMDGHYYIVINKGDSQNTGLTVAAGNVPLLNIKSRSIRAVKYDTLVEIVDLSINVLKPD